MKNRFYKLILALALGLSLGFAANSADAYQCKTVRGYWHNGYYHPAHRVCYHNRVRHCGWRNGQKVCWYN